MDREMYKHQKWIFFSPLKLIKERAVQTDILIKLKWRNRNKNWTI